MSCHSLERVGSTQSDQVAGAWGGEVPEAWWGWWGAAGSAERAAGETPLLLRLQLLLGNTDWPGRNPVYLAAPPPLSLAGYLLILRKREEEKQESEQLQSTANSPCRPQCGSPLVIPAVGPASPFPNCCPASPPAGASWGLGALQVQEQLAAAPSDRPAGRERRGGRADPTRDWPARGCAAVATVASAVGRAPMHDGVIRTLCLCLRVHREFLSVCEDTGRQRPWDRAWPGGPGSHAAPRRRAFRQHRTHFCSSMSLSYPVPRLTVNLSSVD